MSVEKPPTNSVPEASDANDGSGQAFNAPSDAGHSQEALDRQREKELRGAENRLNSKQLDPQAVRILEERRRQATAQESSKPAESTVPPPRWRLKWEKLTGDPEHNQTIKAREEWLTSVLIPKADERDLKVSLRRQEVWGKAKELLLHSPGPGVTTVLDRMSKEPGVYERAMDLLNRLDSEGKSVLELTDGKGITMQDLKAMRLVGLTLLQAGYGREGQRSFSQLHEDEKRLVRLGEIIGLDAESKMIERMMVSGTMDEARARAAHKRYRYYMRTDDLPEVFYKRFASLNNWLQESYKISELRPREPGIQSESVTGLAEQDRSRPVESVRGQVQPERSPETPKSAVPEAVPKAEVAADLQDKVMANLATTNPAERQAAEKFMESFADQIDYAQYINDKSSIGGRLAGWVEKTFRRPDMHGRVFGFWGVVRASMFPRTADQRMHRVREQTAQSLKSVASKTGNTELAKYAKTLLDANTREAEGIYVQTIYFEQLGKLSKWAWRKWQELRQINAQRTTIMDGFSNQPIPSSADPGVIDLEMNPQTGAYEPQGTAPENIHTPPSDEEVAERRLFTNVQEWQRLHPDWGYADWAVTASKLEREKFDQIVKERNIKRAQLWDSLKKMSGPRAA